LSRAHAVVLPSGETGDAGRVRHGGRKKGLWREGVPLSRRSRKIRTTRARTTASRSRSRPAATSRALAEYAALEISPNDNFIRRNYARAEFYTAYTKTTERPPVHPGERRGLGALLAVLLSRSPLLERRR
jgi:hypothetical protein